MASGGRLPDGRASWREGTGRCTTRTTGNELCYLRPSLLAALTVVAVGPPRGAARGSRVGPRKQKWGGGGQRQKQVGRTGTLGRAHAPTHTHSQPSKRQNVTHKHYGHHRTVNKELLLPELQGREIDRRYPKEEVRRKEGGGRRRM